MIRRLPVLALAAVGLLAGLYGGLLRLGWVLPAAPPLAGHHGALMVSAFLGTLIGVERAVALGRPAGWIAPVLSGVGMLAVVLGLPVATGGWLVVAGSLALVGASAAAAARQVTPWTVALVVAAAAWAVGNGLWAAGWSVPDLVPWWIAFLVGTIAAERLELSRLSRPSPRKRPLFYLALGTVALGVALTVAWRDPGLRVLGLGLVGLTAWLLVFDVARRTLRRTGLPRFVAASLLSGYAWLGLAGVGLLAWGLPVAGPVYDALLHAVLVGFVFSMIFGHAPIILPAVTRIAVGWTPAFYLPLGLLHLSLAARVAGDLGAGAAARRWGGLGNAVAILLFFALVVGSAIRTRRGRSAAR